MYELLWWWMLLLLPVPLLVRWFWPKTSPSTGVALKVPALEDFELAETKLPNSWLSRFALLFASLMWVALVAALARPVWIGEPMSLPMSGRDLMLAVDLSGSMREEDFQLLGHTVNRLEATQAVASEFIKRREGDRIGMIVFGDQAFLQVPLTFDLTTVRRLLSETFIGLAGDRTAIGDAIGLAIKRLKDNPEKNRVLILMTDGANTAGTVSPQEATDMAATAGLKIYTVGIGSEQGFNMGGAGAGFFSLNTPSADLDEGLLRRIASKTGGQYFRARDTNEFEHIYTELDRLEPIKQQEKQWRPQKELFSWPLLAALGLGLGMLALRRLE